MLFRKSPQAEVKTTNDKQALYESLTCFGAVPASEWTFLATHISAHQFGPRASLVGLGDGPGQFHFIIVHGLVRLYCVAPDGRELVKSFAKERQMTGPLLAWLAGKPSPIAIQAVEVTRTLAFTVRLVETLLKRDPAWERIVRGYVDKLAHQTESRNLDLLLHTGKQRYRRFVEGEPDLHARLPLNQIAAYLGLSNVSLSRIRRELHLTNVKASMDRAL